MILAYLPLLGLIAGLLIAWKVPDETEWYQRHFRLASVAGIIALVIISQFTSSYPLIAILGCAAVFIGLIQLWPWLLAVGAGVISATSGILALQVLLLTLIPAAGYHFSRARQKSLWWLFLMPIVIFAMSFLV